MIDLRYQVLRAGIAQSYEDFPRRTHVEMNRAFINLSKAFARRIGKERLAKPGRPGDGDSGDRLHRRTGSLARGLTSSVTGGTLQTLKATIGWTDSRSARIALVHERGATIRPKTKRFLAIPLPAALTPAGVERQDGPRSYPEAFIIRSKLGNLIIARTTGRGGSIEPLYALKSQVKIPPRLGFVREWQSREWRTEVLRRMSVALRLVTTRGRRL